MAASACGYLCDLTQKAEYGEFSPGPVLMALVWAGQGEVGKLISLSQSWFRRRLWGLPPTFFALTPEKPQH
jgi:hypothetical protein